MSTVKLRGMIMTGTNKPNIMSAITNGGRASSVEEKLDNILELSLIHI